MDIVNSILKPKEYGAIDTVLPASLKRLYREGFKTNQNKFLTNLLDDKIQLYDEDMDMLRELSDDPDASDAVAAYYTSMLKNKRPVSYANPTDPAVEGEHGDLSRGIPPGLDAIKEIIGEYSANPKRDIKDVFYRKREARGAGNLYNFFE